MKVATDKTVYEFNEAITVTVSVENHGTQVYELSEAPFYCPGRDLFGTWPPPGERVQPLPDGYLGILRSPKGTGVSSNRLCGRRRIDRRPSTIELDPGERHSIAINLRDHYSEDRGGPGGSQHSLDLPGAYELSAKYHLYYANTWPEAYAGIFIGPLESNTVTFTIKPLEGAQMEELLDRLEHGDADAKIEAFNLLRRGERVSEVPDINRYLNEKQPKGLRQAAGLAVMNAPDVAEWKTYASYVDDPDLSTLMVRSLEVIGTKEAVDALYAVTDSASHPNCYGAAFGALVRLNDPRTEEVAARLEKSAPDEWVRKFARDQLNKRSQK